MRVGIIALLQESNTFIAAPTTLAHFEQDLLVEGDASKRLIRVDTPGVTSTDLSRLEYHQHRRPLFPLEGEAEC